MSATTTTGRLMAISDKIKAMVALLERHGSRGFVVWWRGDDEGTGQAAWTLEQGTVGGERNTSSATKNYTVTKNECNATVISNDCCRNYYWRRCS